LTSFESSVFPLWNLTPFRSLNVHVRASGVACQLTARSGRTVHTFGTSMNVRRSYRFCRYGDETAIPVWIVGSVVSAAEVSV
jgi:hypothetical protein